MFRRIGQLVVCVFALLGVCVVIALFSNRDQTSSSARSPQRVVSAPQPSLVMASSTPLPPISLEEIVSTHQRMTDLQREEWDKSLVGRRIYSRATVSDVTSTFVVLRIPGTTLGSVYLRGLPKEEALSVQKEMLLTFDGIIQKVEDGLMGISVSVERTVLVK